MKRIIFGCAVLISLCLLGYASAGEKTTTILVYLCGTDLQESACDDLIEMAEVEAGDTINLVVLAGGANEWSMEDLQGGVQNLAVIRDGYFEELENWGKGSMGAPESLEKFLKYGMTRFPADRMIVILWDHGAGTEGGICFDETADDDCLTMAEINQTMDRLQQSIEGFHINIFGCDACMMATYEMASMLSAYPIDYFVASEELEPEGGWYYTEWIDLLKRDPGTSDPDLCRSIVNSYMKKSLAEAPDDYLTLSAMELTGIRELKNCMERFATTISEELSGGNLNQVRRGRSRMYAFGSFDDASWDMVDLGAMLDAYAQFDPDLASEAKRLLRKAVVCSSQTDNLDPCSGLSILLPQDTTKDFEEYRDGLELSGVIPNWMDFIYGYVTMLNGGHYQISSASVSHVGRDDVVEGDYTSSASFGSYGWNDVTESYDEYETEEVTVNLEAQGFTASLSPEDLEYLDYVEGVLMMPIDDDGATGFVEFGTMRNNLIDWKTGRVLSLYDGSWPVFGGQPVPMYDQTSNEHSRRSLIPVKLNGQYTYLVVVFPAEGTEGRIVGANAGYDQNGLPVRSVTQLKPGDILIPVYTFYYEADGKREMEEAEFDGDPITWQEGMTVTYEDLSDEEDPVEMYFWFEFTDIFGEYTMSEMISFEL